MKIWVIVALIVGCQPSPKPPSYPLKPATACGETSSVVVLGAVQRPGTYECRAGMHLGDAVGVAGGMTPLANSNGVMLTRGTVRYRVHLGRIVEGEAPDPELGPDDTVFVGERDI